MRNPIDVPITATVLIIGMGMVAHAATDDPDTCVPGLARETGLFGIVGAQQPPNELARLANTQTW